MDPVALPAMLSDVSPVQSLTQTVVHRTDCTAVELAPIVQADAPLATLSDALAA